MPNAMPTVDLDRFMETLAVSARIGVGREGGLSRLALGDADRQMRDLFRSWCEAAGLTVTIDAMGSIFARREGRSGTLPPILVGSHLDTQENGGRFDGIVGVLGGLELLRTLNDLAVETERAIEVVNWTNEEGARFSPPMVASGCFCGAYDLDWAHGRTAEDGCSLGDELERIGYRGEGRVGGREVDAYFELHIEQGDVLDTARRQVGVVTHAYSSHGMIVEFEGETAHTGPWPMERRRNALVAGARLLTAVDDIGWQQAETGGKGTAARLVAWPNKAGIVSDWSQAVCDVRHENPETARRMYEDLVEAAESAGRRAQCTSKIVDRWSWGGNIFDPELISGVRDLAGTLGYTSLELPSQAGHDAYFMARICPTAMIFTPCEGGITHNNREFVSAADLEPGLNVLLHSVWRRADRP